MTDTARVARAGLLIGLIGLAILTPPAAIVTAQTMTRFENTSTAVSYSGFWELGNTDRPWSGDTAAVSTAALARATLTFTGIGVSWIGFRGPQAGIARVFLDGALVTTVDTFADEEELAALLFTVGSLANAAHTLTIEITGGRNPNAIDNYIVVDYFDVTTATAGGGETFAPGDVFVSLETGPVQWRRPDGTLVRTMTGAIPGRGEGMGFDAAGRLYLTLWRLDEFPMTSGNTTEVFDVHGESIGTFGSGYDCDPHAIVFAPSGAAYVGQAGCSGAVLEFAPGQPPVQYDVAPDAMGAFWIDLAADGCTLFYTSWGPNVKRFNVCTDLQRPNFNRAPLPGGVGHDLRVLPDGGVLVSSGEVIARLNASGTLIRTYSVPGEWSPWTGLDLIGDGTFWAGNYESSNVYRFNLANGSVVDSFNTGTAPHTVVGIRVRK
jgi:hypothetical protein